MPPRIAYLADGKLHVVEPGQAPRALESRFAESVRDRHVRLQKRAEWKAGGSSFAAQMARAPQAAGGAAMFASITGLSRGCREGEILYSLATSAVVGLFALDVATGEETRLFHRNSERISFPARCTTWTHKLRARGSPRAGASNKWWFSAEPHRGILLRGRLSVPPHGGPRGRMRRVTSVLLFSIGLWGCAHQPQPSAQRKPAWAPPPAHGTRLAVIPVDSDLFPEVADWVSNLLQDVRVTGIDEYFKAKVTLEVVQLSIECVDATPACYTAVGKSLNANKLLMAHIGTGSGKRRDKTVKVSISLFDVDSGTQVSTADQVFKNKDEALANAEDLVNRAVGNQAAAASRGAAR